MSLPQGGNGGLRGFGIDAEFLGNAAHIHIRTQLAQQRIKQAHGKLLEMRPVALLQQSLKARTQKQAA
jgi:hypothetical protein